MNDKPIVRFDSATAKSCRRVGDRLQVVATVSRTATQKGDGLKYLKADGGIQEEFLTPEELFDEDSIDTARMAPVTFGHPSDGGLVGDRWSEFSVGAAGSSVIARQDEGLLDLVFTIGDRAAVDEAERAAQQGQPLEVSAGYTTIVVNRDGELHQTQRRYDHFAVLPMGVKARAGKTAKLHMDNQDWAIQKVDGEDMGQTQYRNDNAVIDLLHEGIWAKKQEVAKGIIKQIAELTGNSTDSVETILYDFFALPSEGFLQAAAQVLDLDASLLTGLAQQIKDLEKRQRSDAMPTSIPLSDRIFNIDGADAPALATAVAELVQKTDQTATELSTIKGESEGHKARADQAEADLETARTDLTQTKTKLDETQTKLDEAEQAAHGDADQLSTEMSTRIQAWAEVLPTLRADNATFEPDYKLDETDIHRLFLLKANPGLATNEQFKTDNAFVQGLWTALKPTDNLPVVSQPKTDTQTHNFDHLLTLASVTTGDRTPVATATATTKADAEADTQYRKDQQAAIDAYQKGTP